MSKKPNKQEEILTPEETQKHETENESSAQTEEAAVCAEQALQQQLAELNDKFLRTVAEYDNFRKRSQKEKEMAYWNASADMVAKFLPVLDSMERALTFECKDAEYKKGVDMIISSFYEAMQSGGVEEIPAQVGDPFDPQLHNAVMHIEDENLDKNVLVQVLQKGYHIGEKVIRHAMVQVAN